MAEAIHSFSEFFFLIAFLIFIRRNRTIKSDDICFFVFDVAKLERTFQRGFTRIAVENAIISVFRYSRTYTPIGLISFSEKMVITPVFFVPTE
ncbi:hypothetical protein [Bacteroides clarus]|uniref:hypothetical protein n=1 Tax=Bacteroides clarus TaxID=626929 RepID=UPI001898022F|nr:hypothetical protein [Bacteroides clarus]